MDISNHRGFFRFGAWGAVAQVCVLFVMIIAGAVLGARPETAREFLEAYGEQPFATLLRDDFSSLVLIALYAFTFPALFRALYGLRPALVTFSVLATFMAIILSLATNAALSLMHLGEQYAQVASGVERQNLLLAAEAVLASDMWHSSAGYFAGLLLQGSGILISVVMLGSRDFMKWTAVAGIIANSGDLIQHLLHGAIPGLGTIILYVAGPFYLVWYILLAHNFFSLVHKDQLQTTQSV